jgi:hypothetical protein
MERELLVEEEGAGMELFEDPGTVPVRPSKSKDGPASPVGVLGLGVEQDPRRRAAFSSSLFFRQAALGLRWRSLTCTVGGCGHMINDAESRLHMWDTT